MYALKQHRSTAKALPDLLNWAAVIDDGVVLNKDGSLMAGWYYRGQDLAIVTAAERNHISAKINAALAKLGSEWMIHQDAIRVEASVYPDANRSAFPDPVTGLIEAERRAHFMAKGRHYESAYALIVTFLPEKANQSKVVDLFFEDSNTSNAKNKAKKNTGNQILRQFKNALQDIEDGLSDSIELTRMMGVKTVDEDGREHIEETLLQYLHYSLTGLPHPINLPPCPMYLDAVIGGHEFWSGIVPKLEDKFIQIVAIDGFPQESYPGILAALDQVPIKYRWNTRFIFQDTVDAMAGLKAYCRKWQQKVRGFWDQVFHSEQTAKGTVDQDALQMVNEADEALSEASSGLIKYGYYTSTVVLMDESREYLDKAAREIKKLVNSLGFNARIETVNTVEAWLGSLPGHSAPNIRRPMLHTMHLADMLPLSSIWAGSEQAPCPMYPENSPSLFHADTQGSTPFRFNLHIDDLGHTLIMGPTGSGKSVLLAFIAAQSFRYENMKVFAFDKGMSLEPLVRACAGKESHFNIAGDSKESNLCFAPLSSLNEPGEIGWANDWVCTLLELQGLTLTPEQRNTVQRALVAVRDGGMEKTLTSLQVEIQDRALKDALETYTVSGAYGELLDAVEDGLNVGRFACFEIEQLMNRDQRISLPVLLYLFHVLERRMKGRPCLLILDEAWLMLGNDVFRAKIREWLKVLRKANCAVILATQSISDAANSGILDVLSESCPSKIFLANPEADSEDNIALYKAMGCNAAEVLTIKHLTRKREYFVRGEGRRRIELSLGPVALSFVAAGSKDNLARIRMLEAEHGKDWPYKWLEERKVSYEHL